MGIGQKGEPLLLRSGGARREQRELYNIRTNKYKKKSKKKMEKLFILNIYLYIAVLFLSFLIIFCSKKGYLTLKLKFYFVNQTLGEFIVLLFSISDLIVFMLYLLLCIISLLLNVLFFFLPAPFASYA